MIDDDRWYKAGKRLGRRLSRLGVALLPAMLALEECRWAWRAWRSGVAEGFGEPPGAGEGDRDGLD